MVKLLITKGARGRFPFGLWLHRNVRASEASSDVRLRECVSAVVMARSG